MIPKLKKTVFLLKQDERTKRKENNNNLPVDVTVEMTRQKIIFR
jgi:hypothetical protein